MGRVTKAVFPKMISDTILEIPGSECIIVGLCEIDGKQYGAFVDISIRHPITETYKGYINEVRLSKSKDTFMDNFVIYDDEEWTVISEFFDKSGVFEMNRIERWIWSRINGMPMIPKWMYADADKKRRKVVGMDRSDKKKLKISTQSSDDKLRINWNDNTKKA